MWDIIGLGIATVDDLLYAPSFPQPDTKIQIVRSSRHMGGLTAVALAVAARLGSRCAYAGVLGHDDISRFVEQTLQAEGVDTSLVPYRDDAQPVYARIIVDLSGHTRTILYEMTGRNGAADDQPAADAIRQTRVLFIDDYGVTGNLRAGQIARAAGIPVVADFERDDTPHFQAMLALVDHLILSARFAQRISGTSHPAEAAQKLWTDTRSAVVVTCGDRGCWYVAADQSEPLHVPAFSVAVVDTTGCGDVFHGAYASALARGVPIAERVRFASAAAALKATQEGLDGIPDRQRVEAFMNEHPG